MAVSLTGLLGTVVTRVRGGELPGEIQVTVNGIPERLIAYCSDPVEPGEPVLVYHDRGGRAVDVEHAPWAAV